MKPLLAVIFGGLVCAQTPKVYSPEKHNFWSFRAIKDTGSSIDWFIQEKLAEKGLKAARPASKAALIRRSTFDLTGLPPTEAEIDAFLADQSPDAYTKVVDKLLAS